MLLGMGSGVFGIKVFRARRHSRWNVTSVDQLHCASDSTPRRCHTLVRQCRSRPIDQPWQSRLDRVAARHCSRRARSRISLNVASYRSMNRATRVVFDRDYHRLLLLQSPSARHFASPSSIKATRVRNVLCLRTRPRVESGWLFHLVSTSVVANVSLEL